MGELWVVSLFVSAFLVMYLGWKAFYGAWWKPMKLKRYLSEQGLRAPPYKILLGNFKDAYDATNKAQSKPMPLCHDIAPYVLPFHHEAVQKYGKLSYTWFGVTPRVNIMDPDIIREIFSNKNGNVSKKKLNAIARLISTGLTSLEGEKWARHRRIINPAFHLEKLKMMVPAFYTSCSELASKWEKMASDGPCEVDVWPDLQCLTADVISRTAFGTNYEDGRRIFQLQREQGDLALKAAQSLYFPGYRFIPTKRNQRMKEIAREVRMLIRNLISMREKAMKNGEGHSKDLLGLMLEANAQECQGLGMSIDEIIGECKLFYIAGQETTSTLLVWTLVVLSMHPEWQERAREEVLKAFGTSTKPDFDVVNHLKIVTMILHEVLRLYPPVVLLARANHKEFKIGKAVIPPGVEFGLPVLLIHHDRELWGEDALEFNPERFAGGVANATNNRICFFPFGWGPRVCLGQTFALLEAKMALAMILQRFSFELSPTYRHSPHSTLTLFPRYGAQVILQKL